MPSNCPPGLIKVPLNRKNIAAGWQFKCSFGPKLLRKFGFTKKRKNKKAKKALTKKRSSK